MMAEAIVYNAAECKLQKFHLFRDPNSRCLKPIFHQAIQNELGPSGASGGGTALALLAALVGRPKSCWP